MNHLHNVITSIACTLAAAAAHAHPANTPSEDRFVLGAEFDRDHVHADAVHAVSGHHLRTVGPVSITTDALGESLELLGAGLDGQGAYVLVADSVEQFDDLPTHELTVTSWVRIDEPTRWGGILSAVSDNGDREKGWVLGYDNDSFTFGISTTGADDGDGAITYLNGKTAFEPGHWYMVTATFDGESARLYVNGTLEAETTHQHGEVLYEQQTPIAVGAYIDSNELHTMQGRIRNVYLFDEAMTQEQIAREFERNRVLAELEPAAEAQLEWTVEPFLCYATQRSISVVCELPAPAEVTLRYRPPSETCARSTPQRRAASTPSASMASSPASPTTTRSSPSRPTALASRPTPCPSRPRSSGARRSPSS